MMVAFLQSTDFGLKPEDLRPILAHHASGRRNGSEGGVRPLLGLDVVVAPILECEHLFAIAAGSAIRQGRVADLLHHTLGKGFENLGMVTQIGSVDEFDLGVLRRDPVSEAVDAVDQDTREQEVGKHDHAAVTELDDVLQAGFHERERHAGIPHFAPPKAQAFVQKPCDLGHVGVGVGVRGPPAYDNKAGFVSGNGIVEHVFDPLSRSRNHLWVDAQFAPVGHIDSVLGRVGVEYRRNIVLGVHRRKEHTGHRKDAFAALRAQGIKTVPDHRIGKFQISIVGHPVGRQVGWQLVRKLREFIHSSLRPRAVPTDHHTRLTCVAHKAESRSDRFAVSAIRASR